MSDQHFPIESEDTRSGDNADSVHGEIPFIRRKKEPTPERYKRQRNNPILTVLLVILTTATFAAFPYIKAVLLGGVVFLAPMVGFASPLSQASALLLNNLPYRSRRGLAEEYCVRVSFRMLMSPVGKLLILTDSPERAPLLLCRTVAPARRC